VYPEQAGPWQTGNQAATRGSAQLLTSYRTHCGLIGRARMPRPPRPRPSRDKEFEMQKSRERKTGAGLAAGGSWPVCNRRRKARQVRQQRSG